MVNAFLKRARDVYGPPHRTVAPLRRTSVRCPARTDSRCLNASSRPRGPTDRAPVRVNLYSDTQTRPSAAMKEAMMRAEVGDEQHGDDPTMHALCDRMAALLGKEAAVFLPSGTMCNQIAILTHCRPGDEILAHETAHIISQRGRRRLARWPAPGHSACRASAGSSTPTRCSAAFRAKTPQCPAADAWWRWSRPPMTAAARSGRWTG